MNRSRLAVLVVALLIVTAVVLRVTYGLPSLSGEELNAARALWEQAGPEDYDITILVSGRQAAEYRVEVRGGVAVQAWRNGQPLKQPRTFATWSVPGMFQTMQRDVDHMEGSVPVRDVGRLKLFSRFDSALGYPTAYLRVESGVVNNDVSWRVTHFEMAGRR